MWVDYRGPLSTASCNKVIDHNLRSPPSARGEQAQKRAKLHSILTSFAQEMVRGIMPVVAGSQVKISVPVALVLRL